MNTPVKPLIELVKDLPPDIQAEVRDFAEFLLAKKIPKSGGRLRQDWGGALREHRHQYTSLGLQQKAVEWRED